MVSLLLYFFFICVFLRNNNFGIDLILLYLYDKANNKKNKLHNVKKLQNTVVVADHKLLGLIKAARARSCNGSTPALCTGASSYSVLQKITPSYVVLVSEFKNTQRNAEIVYTWITYVFNKYSYLRFLIF